MSRSSLAFLALVACSTTFNGGTDPAAVDGSAASASDLAPVSIRLRMDAPVQRFDAGEPAPEGCPDESEGGVRGEAVATGMAVKVRSITLLGADGTDDVALVRETRYSEADWVELTEDGVEMEVAEIPLGTYDGIELSVWAVQAEMPMVVPEIGDGTHAFTMWFNEQGYLAPRDITVSVDELDHWIDLEASALVEVPESWDADPSKDTGYEFDEYGYAPAERLRLRDDKEFWYESPVVHSSDDGDLDFETPEGETSVTLAREVELAEGIEVDMTVLELTFQSVDTMTWWESSAAAADGVYDPAEDCGLDVRMPGVVATATVGGEMPEIPEEEVGDTGATDTADPEL